MAELKTQEAVVEEDQPRRPSCREVQAVMLGPAEPARRRRKARDVMSKIKWDRAKSETRGPPAGQRGEGIGQRQEEATAGSASAEDFAAVPAVQFKHDPLEGCLG